MTNREDVDEGTRKDLEDMLSRGEKLRRRIQGVVSDESDQETSEDEDGSDIGESIARIKQGAFDELAKIGDEEIVESDGKKKGQSIFEMKFMKDAMARQAATVNKEVDDFTREMGGTVVSDSEGEATKAPEKDSSTSAITVRTGGRVVYRPGEIVSEHEPVIFSLLTFHSSRM
jgi:U3 small nucleolar RNA-associated protein 14